MKFLGSQATHFYTGMQLRAKIFIFVAAFLAVIPTYVCLLDISKKEYVSSRFTQAEPVNNTRHAILTRDKEVPLDSTCSLTARVSPRMSLLSYYTGICTVVALWDFLFWMILKFNMKATAIISDRFFSLQPWSGRKGILKFFIGMIFYSLGHGNLFHYLGKNDENFTIWCQNIQLMIWKLHLRQCCNFDYPWTTDRRWVGNRCFCITKSMI